MLTFCTDVPPKLDELQASRSVRYALVHWDFPYAGFSTVGRLVLDMQCNMKGAYSSREHRFKVGQSAQHHSLLPLKSPYSSKDDRKLTSKIV